MPRRFGQYSATVTALPVLSTLTGTFSLPEDAIAGDVAGPLVGYTAGSTLSLVDDAAGHVALSGTNVVRGAAALDYETATSHSFTVRETLSGATNTPRDTVLTMTVTNVIETGNAAGQPIGLLLTLLKAA